MDGTDSFLGVFACDRSFGVVVAVVLLGVDGIDLLLGEVGTDRLLGVAGIDFRGVVVLLGYLKTSSYTELRDISIIRRRVLFLLSLGTLLKGLSSALLMLLTTSDGVSIVKFILFLIVLFLDV